jgi:hypothetical protein
MKFGLTIYNKTHIHGADDDQPFVSEQRAINDARRMTRSGVAFKVEIWRLNEHDGKYVRIDVAPIRVYFGAVADGLREHVERVVPRPFSVSRR